MFEMHESLLNGDKSSFLDPLFLNSDVKKIGKRHFGCEVSSFRQENITFVLRFCRCHHLIFVGWECVSEWVVCMFRVCVCVKWNITEFVVPAANRNTAANRGSYPRVS